MKEIERGNYTEYASNKTIEVDGDFITGLAYLPIEDSSVPHGHRLSDYSYIMLLIDKLAARSYALIEACVPNKEQQNAFKDSLRGIVNEQRDKAYRELHDVVGK